MLGTEGERLRAEFDDLDDLDDCADAFGNLSIDENREARRLSPANVLYPA